MSNVLLKGTLRLVLGHNDRAAGDRARDAGDWARATRHYQSFLRMRPRNFSILVQYGNVLKEGGHYDRALRAYEKAVALRPRDADIHLQLGHLFKLMQRTDEAIRAYRRSLDLGAESNPALHELLNLGADGLVKADSSDDTSSQTRILFDFTDFVIYLRHNDSMSGIQRVVANLLQGMLKAESKYSCEIWPVLPDYHQMQMHRVQRSLVTALIEAVENNRGRTAINGLLDLIETSKIRIDPQQRLRAGDVFTIAGAFWIYGRYDLLAQLRRLGIAVYVYVHDLIQITDPQYVAKDATNDFRKSFFDVVNVASAILTNSEFVAGEVRRYVAKNVSFSLPVKAVTLATELKQDHASTQHIAGPELRPLLGTRYVLFVSTIEVRKNHRYVLDLWERFIADGDVDVPNLVFVGKWGWQVEQLRSDIEDSDYLGGRLFIFNGIPDGDLAALYKHCLFTVYPSFAEGWGLPVGESLAYGKPCVATRATAVPEVGGDLCLYIDPFNVEEGHAVIKPLLAEPRRIERWTETVRSRFKPKTWPTFTDEFFGALISLKEQNTTRDINTVLVPGEIAYFGHGAILQAGDTALPSARLSRVSGWHQLEGWGCWAASRRAQLQMPTPSAPGVAVEVFLLACAPDEETAADCIVDIEGVRTIVEGLGSLPRWYRLNGRLDGSGHLSILLTAGRGFGRRLDEVARYIGVIALAFVPADDPGAVEAFFSHLVAGPTRTAV